MRKITSMTIFRNLITHQSGKFAVKPFLRHGMLDLILKGIFAFSYLCAIPAACCWGCNFACLAFEHIWCLTPSIKYCKISYYPLMRLYSFAIQCLCVPFFEAVALVFSKVGIYRSDEPPQYKSRQEEFATIMARI